MDNSKNMEPGIRNATVQESLNKEQRKKEKQTRNQREGTDHSGLSSRLFPLRGRFHTGNGRLQDGQRRYRNGEVRRHVGCQPLSINTGLPKKNGTTRP